MTYNNAMESLEGILPVYKPVGMSSYDVLRIFKKYNRPPDGQKKWKIGHGGTLDPFAEGVLLVLLGRSATKKFDTLRQLKKTYLATIVVGASSDTLDCTGKISLQNSESAAMGGNFLLEVLIDKIKAAIPNFVGEIEQKIPDYSAAKIAGKPRYQYARAGHTLAPKSKKVTIYELKIVEYKKNEMVIETTVSAGTYIRQLSYDLLQAVGVESYLKKLNRLKIGGFLCEQACTIEDLKSGDWRRYLVSSEQMSNLGQ